MAAPLSPPIQPLQQLNSWWRELDLLFDLSTYRANQPIVLGSADPASGNPIVPAGDSSAGLDEFAAYSPTIIDSTGRSVGSNKVIPTLATQGGDDPLDDGAPNGPPVTEADRRAAWSERPDSLVSGLLGPGIATSKPTVCRCKEWTPLIVGVTSSGAGLAAPALGSDLTFKLHSNPTANQLIYLDFDGYTLASSEWENGAALQVGAFYASPFSAAAQQAIQDIWRRVAEDFAPFNIDVTTEAPNSEDLKNSGPGDSRWGIRVAMTTNKNLLTNASIINAGGGGSAFAGSFNWATDDVCLVFNGYNATDTASIYVAAETVSHEVGHSLGLSHDGGSYGSNPEYYEGHGSGDISWGTIMGAPFINANENVTTWSQGGYIGANNQEDDLGIITGSVSNAYVDGNGFTYRDDDYGDSLATAYTLSGTATSYFGIIERNTDVDWFRFSTGTDTASVSLSIRNASRVFSSNGDGTFSTQYLDGLGPNLAISAQLFNASGVLIATSTPIDRLDVNFNLTLAAGDYYLSVEGVGFGTPLANPPSGFSDYGSLGQYLITSAITAPVASNVSVVITAINDNTGTITGPIADGGSTNDTTPTLTGTIAAALAAGSTVRVYRNGVDAGNATITGTTWSYTPAPALTSGAYSFKAAIFSSSGVAGPFSDPRSIVVDTTVPLQTVTIASVSDNTDPIQGLVAAGGRTNDNAPTLTGTLSAPLGEGESIKLYNGTTVMVNALVDNATLTWVATPTLTADATYALTARVVDAAGNQGPLSASRSLILDTTAPLQQVAITAISDNAGTITGLIANGAVTNDTTPSLSGTLSAALATADVVRVYSNGVLSGNAVVKGITWSYTPATALNINGTYAFTAQVIDGAGNSGPLSAPRSIVLDTAAPTKTVAINSVSDNTDPVVGVVAAGGRTNDTTPTLSGTLSAALEAGEALKLYKGTTVLVDAVVDNTTLSWSATPTLTADGTTTITARVLDSAGNQGPASPSRVLILDTTAPTQVVAINNVADNAGTIQGTVAVGANTNDTTPTLTGTFGGATAGAALAAGETLYIFSNGALAGNATVTVVAAGQSSWSFTPTTPLSTNGTYSFTAQVVDGAGNGGTLSAPFSIVLDAPISTAAQDTLTGIAASADIDLLPQLSYSLLGSAATPTYDTITNFEAIDKLQVSGRAYKANLTSSSGTAPGLDASQLAAVLPATWAANTARAFKVNGFNGTFVALNNNVAGFQSDQDAILFLNAYNPSASTPIGIL